MQLRGFFYYIVMKETDIRKKTKKQYILSSKEKKDIYTMLFGPYEDEWYDENGIVDNTDVTIARRLNISRVSVAAYTNRLCHMHFNKINSNG
jgi:hypothetical protein